MNLFNSSIIEAQASVSLGIIVMKPEPHNN